MGAALTYRRRLVDGEFHHTEVEDVMRMSVLAAVAALLSACHDPAAPGNAGILQLTVSRASVLADSIQTVLVSAQIDTSARFVNGTVTLSTTLGGWSSTTPGATDNFILDTTDSVTVVFRARTSRLGIPAENSDTVHFAKSSP